MTEKKAGKYYQMTGLSQQKQGQEKNKFKKRNGAEDLMSSAPLNALLGFVAT
jgi:hypothetical protein